jgi:hypothetical protein
MKAVVRRIDNFDVITRKFLIVIENGAGVPDLRKKVEAILKKHGAGVVYSARGEVPLRKSRVSEYDIHPGAVCFQVRAKGSHLVEEKKKGQSGFPILVNMGTLIEQINEAIYNKADDIRGQEVALNNRLVAIEKEKEAIENRLRELAADKSKPLTAIEALTEIHEMCQDEKEKGRSTFILSNIRLTAALALDNEASSDLSIKVGQFVGNYLYTTSKRMEEWSRMDSEEQMEKVRELIKSDEFKRHLKK